MISIEKSDLKNLEYVGMGGFGDIYKKGDLVYKIYKPKVPSGYSSYVDNPSLKYHPFKINRLLSLRNKLMYSDLISDTVFMNGKFAGVSMPFYDGVPFYRLDNTSFDKRIKLSFKLVKSFKELTDYYIYPLDFKLDNVMDVNGHVKMIDLDDCLTKVSFVARRNCLKECVHILDVAIKGFLQEYCGYHVNYLKDYLSKKPNLFCNSYDDIFNYLNNKAEMHPYIIINDESNISSNVALLRDSNFRVLYVRDSFAEFDNICYNISRFNVMGISIYDVILKNNCEHYLNNISCNKVFEICGDNVIRKNLCH